MPTGEYSVCQFLEDGSYEYVRRFVDIDEALGAFKHYTDNIATRLGLIARVIITDGGDCINLEWQKGKGITFPTKEEVERES